MNPSSQMLILIVFGMAGALMYGIYFALHKQGVHAKGFLREVSLAWERLHCLCVLGGAYFALFTFQVLIGGLNFEVQFF
jgi:hypothetical protein